MQDFIKAFKLKPNGAQLEFNIPNRPKVGFIASRMNKDNCWNLVFWLGMFLGFGASELIAQPISGIICWIAIIGMPYLVKRNSNITCDKIEQGAPMFIVNGNKRINATGIGFVALLVVSFFIAVLITRVDSIPVFFLVLWFVPTLYCILRNIPIAVYFKKEAWIGDGSVPFHSLGNFSTSSSFRLGRTTSSSSCYSSRSTASSSSRDSIITSPSYRWHPTNIYHRR